LGRPAEGRAPAGWRVVAVKEFSDHLSSIRFTILVAIMGLATVAAVAGAAGGIREVAQEATGFPALFLRIFTVGATERINISFAAIVAVLGPVLGIAFGFDAVNQERSQGTLPRLVSQPIYRDDVINGKFVAGLSVISLALVSITIVVGGVGILRLGIVPTSLEVIRMILWLLLSVVYIGFWLALASLFSVVLHRAATSALAAFSVWLVLTLFGGLVVGITADVVAPLPEDANIEEQLRNARVSQTLSRVALPSFLYQEATVALLEPDARTFDILGSLTLQQPESRALPSTLSLGQSLLLVWPQLSALLALSALCFAGAYVSFMRQEVRA
jgi:ABC-2 type transport system permease protein